VWDLRQFRRDISQNVVWDFMRRIGKPDERGCMPWLGHIQKARRGFPPIAQFIWDDGIEMIHTTAARACWRIWRCDLGKGDHVLHSCGSSECVNLEHLYLGIPAWHVSFKKQRSLNQVGTKIEQYLQVSSHGSARPLGDVGSFLENELRRLQSARGALE
jgi:hypothetical protein